MIRGHHPLPSGLRAGDVVGGKYRIGEVIGAGAMGTVVAARHVLLDEDVAIKFLRPEALGHSEAIPRFLREAQTSRRITSTHVVRVSDVDLLEESNIPYIVMELLEGCDLAEWLEQHGPLPVPDAVEFMLQACEAISEANRLGIIHRDLKPANLFRVRRGEGADFIKVVDFGISKLSELPQTLDGSAGIGADRPITHDRVMMGSPVYMSPEQMESARDVDERTDVWALGVTLYELVTGKLPFSGQSVVQVYSSIASTKASDLEGWSPDLPRGLQNAILKCLERNRDERFRSVSEFALAISEFGSRASTAYDHRLKASEPHELGLAETVGPVASGAQGGQTLPSAVAAAPTGKTNPPRRVRWWIAGGLAILVSIFLFTGLRGRRASSEAAAVTPRERATAPVASSPPPSARTAIVLSSPPVEPGPSVLVPISKPKPSGAGVSGPATATTSRTTLAVGKDRAAPGPTARPSEPIAAAAGDSISVEPPKLDSGKAVAAPPTPSSSPTAPPTSVLDRMLQKQD